MSDVDRSRYLTVTRESVAAAADEAARYMGGPFRFTKGNRYFLRFMPAFKVNAQGLPQWWSYGMRHYGIPIIGKEDGKKFTMDCPLSIGARCIPCENSPVFKQMGAWDDFKGCSPRKRVYFNIIDIQNIDAGVQVLEDGPKLWGLLREEFEEENDLIFDPFEGSVLVIHAKDADPWRKLKYAKDHQCSLSEIHEDAMTWALPENLNDLDEQWDFLSLEDQQEKFAFLRTATQIAAPVPQTQIEAAAPAPAPAPVSAGVASILEEAEEDVIEGEVVEEQASPAPAPEFAATVPAPAAPAPAPAPAPTPAAVPAETVAPAAVLEEAAEAVQAAPATGTAAVIAEAAAAASPVPDDAAPTPTPAAAPVAGGGSAALLKYQAGIEGEEETEMPD